jgi:hypothetical protein
MCTLPLILESKFHTHIKRKVKLHLRVLKFIRVDSNRKEKLKGKWLQVFPEIVLIFISPVCNFGLLVSVQNIRTHPHF